MSTKYALVTGASRGIGRAIAEKLAAENYILYTICRSDPDRIRDFPGRCYAGDVGDFDFISEVFHDIERLDVLVNNAGISRFGLLQDISRTEWDEILSVNLSSIYNTCHFAIPLMVRRHSGRIINISSQWGVVGASMEAAYSASKGGVNALTKALAKELSPSGIQVNAIACGVIDTDMNQSLTPEDRQVLSQQIPAGRFGTSEEVADMAWQLIQAPPYLTGQVIGLDGGWI
ncbi:MAG: SDR family NAD(P)-dependent oxidoreductase [Lachnospiraceae bacterium]|nr:SDR family NAD(P)-dependent oxidoreductase [Lachnospiraceae bacterium]